MHSLFKLNNTAPLTLYATHSRRVSAWVVGRELLEWRMDYVKLNYDTKTF